MAHFSSTIEYQKQVQDFYRLRQRRAEEAHIRQLSSQLYDLIGSQAHAAWVEALPDNIGYAEIVDKLEAAIQAASI